MRINVYNEEFTNRVEVIETKASNTGLEFVGLRFYLLSPEELHHNPDDDDTSAITFWIDKERAHELKGLMNRGGIAIEDYLTKRMREAGKG